MKSNTNPYVMGLIFFGILVAVGTLETQESQAQFDYCLKERAMITDLEIVDEIHYCERKTGYTLPEEAYP